MKHVKAIKISADDIKKTLPGYTPAKSDLVHKQSTKLADKAFERALKESNYGTVILMSGGAASGKTEYVDTFLLTEEVIIYDGTLPTLNGFEIKQRNTLKYNKAIEIHAVIPEDIRRAFIAFLNRDRKYPDIHFYRTHSKARKTLLDICKEYPNVHLRIIESSYERGVLQFTELEFTNNEDILAFLAYIQYTEREIQQQVV